MITAWCDSCDCSFGAGDWAKKARKRPRKQSHKYAEASPLEIEIPGEIPSWFSSTDRYKIFAAQTGLRPVCPSFLEDKADPVLIAMKNVEMEAQTGTAGIHGGSVGWLA